MPSSFPTQVRFADLAAVTQLPYVPISFAVNFSNVPGSPSGAHSADSAGNQLDLLVVATITSPLDAVALVVGVHLRLLLTDPRSLETTDIHPVLWDDNFFNLVPGDSLACPSALQSTSPISLSQPLA